MCVFLVFYAFLLKQNLKSKNCTVVTKGVYSLIFNLVWNVMDMILT